MAARVGKRAGGRGPDPAQEAVTAGWELVRRHPMFSHLSRQVRLSRRESAAVPEDGWASVDSASGTLSVHPRRLAGAEQWAWVFSHLLLHLGFGHGERDSSALTDVAGAAAADVIVGRFQDTLKIGRSPLPPHAWPSGSEESLARAWRRDRVPAEVAGCGVAGHLTCITRGPERSWGTPTNWEQLFAYGLTDAVSAAIDVAGGARESMYQSAGRLSAWEQARTWFLSSYPLLGASLATLTVVADAELCRGWDIPIAAVDPVAGELYINPLAQHTVPEWRFILAHEALHAALAHHARAGGRDPYLFNLACDFVINGWLVEMGVGEMPDGLLFDPQFAGMSSEQVYDQIAADVRRYRKLATLRGRDKPDVLGHDHLSRPGAGVDLDELLRRSLATGLDLHQGSGRGTLPAALVAEIRALAQPPLRWDVELARWFDEMFPALEPEQSYSRLSRRQSSTPDIPRPGWFTPQVPVTQRTFGVLLDTSMSMSPTLLGKALGAIASYARARDVAAARVVYCDAVAYDAGFLDVDDIAEKVQVRGRGGTVLQPGVDLLERAPDFPADGPVLIITDGWCDVLRVRREHAFLMPAGASLPFVPKGPVFRFH